MAAFNLAISYRLNGDYVSALHLDQDTPERRRAVLPADHRYHTPHRGPPGAGDAGREQLSVTQLSCYAPP
jgi:hypothetical protein